MITTWSPDDSTCKIREAETAPRGRGSKTPGRGRRGGGEEGGCEILGGGKPGDREREGRVQAGRVNVLGRTVRGGGGGAGGEDSAKRRRRGGSGGDGRAGGGSWDSSSILRSGLNTGRDLSICFR